MICFWCESNLTGNIVHVQIITSNPGLIIVKLVPGNVVQGFEKSSDCFAWPNLHLGTSIWE